MLQFSRRRNLSRSQDWIATDDSNPGGKHISKRPTLLKTPFRRNRLRLVILTIICFLPLLMFSSVRNKYFVLLCRLVTWYFEAHCDSEDVALWRGSHLVQKFPKLDAATRIDLVVSHCDLPIDWIFDWAAPLEFRSINIFSKCGKVVIGAPENAKITEVKNVGRCDHTYALFMANYSSNARDKAFEVSDFVIFLKDNDNSHRNHYSRHKKLDEMIPLAKEFGFSCHEETNWVWSESTLLQPICQISYYHDWKTLQDFRVEKYSRLRRDGNLQFRSQTGETLGDYAQKMGIKAQGFSISINTVTIDPNTDGTRTAIVPVCYGGNFMVQTAQILKRDSAFWERIKSSLSRSDNIAEGHFMERLWGAALAKPIQQDLISRISNQARFGACRVEHNHFGALSK